MTGGRAVEGERWPILTLDDQNVGSLQQERPKCLRSCGSVHCRGKSSVSGGHFPTIVTLEGLQ